MGWSDHFAGLADLSPDLRAELEARSQVIKAPAGTVVFGPGSEADNLLMLISGSVRVQQTSENGREIVLYRVLAGESCVMTTACLISQEAYAAEGVAETPVEAVAIPRKVFDDLVAQSEPFRRFVFNAYAQRLMDLFTVIEDLAFQRVDIRLAQRLARLAGEAGEVKATHADLAKELGTAREVISRQLNEFQRRGWVALRRGVIELLDREALEGLASS
ncbi:MAG: Crp/Fnr family transcriptional regulator [Mangrovicoccus sp.]